jgi:hypothetical protein
MNSPAIVSPEIAARSAYRLESIAKAATPAGCDGVWHSYVIVQGDNTITGMRAGTRADVARQVEEMIERLNERRADRRRSKK